MMAPDRKFTNELKEVTTLDEEIIPEITMEVTVPEFSFDEMLFDTDLTFNIETAHLLPGEEPEVYYTCHVCYKRYASRLYLLLHQACHLAKGTLACKFCKESFGNMEDFSDHIDQHIANSCFTCEMSFLNREDLVEHQKSHEDEDLSKYLYICNICKEHFPNAEELKLHGRRHFSKETQCHTCGKYFSSKSNLNRHIPTHRNVKSFVCDVCQARFTQRISLQSHYLAHANIKPFPCKICDKGFTLKSALTVHLLNHTHETPYACLVCDRRFANKRLFKRHSLQHMPGKESVCDLCGKRFPTKEKLNLHFMTHTNLRPFQCDVCKRGFTYSNHLKRHKMLLHNGRSEFPDKARVVESFKKRHLENMKSVGLEGDMKNWMFCEGGKL